jgi:hypothetical protein
MWPPCSTVTAAVAAAAAATVLPSTAPCTAALQAVNLKSDTGADSISYWLQQHAQQLQQLELSTVGLYSRHIHPPTRLQLFQALHAAAGSTAAEHLGDTAAGGRNGAAAAMVADSASEEEEEPDKQQQQQQQQQEGQLAAAADGSGDQQRQHAAKSSAAAETPSGQSPASVAAGTTTTVQHHSPNQQQQQDQQVKPLRLTHLAVSARLAIPDCAAIASLPAPQLASLALLGSRTRRLGFDGVGSLAQLHQLTSLKVRLACCVYMHTLLLIFLCVWVLCVVYVDVQMLYGSCCRGQWNGSAAAGWLQLMYCACCCYLSQQSALLLRVYYT